MLKRVVSGLMFTLLLTGILGSTFNVQPVKTERNTIIVPDDYPTIQEAINNADHGDTVFVRNGTYYENLTVNKSLTLIGESKDTIISQDYTYVTVEIRENDVIVEGFTIQNYLDSWDPPSIPCGILLNSSSDCQIRDNELERYFMGSVVISGGSGNSIEKNKVQGGIYVFGGSENSIEKNVVEDGSIMVSGSTLNVIIQNTVRSQCNTLELRSSNHNYILYNYFYTCWPSNLCVWMFRSNSNVIEGNTLFDGSYERISRMELVESSNNSIFHNNFEGSISSEVSVDEDSRNNAWDNGYPSGGNHWIDYDGQDVYSGPFQNETGSDRIGDTPHVIDGNNQDNYPLMNQWVPPKNLDTGLSYSTIQEAINAPETLDGHRISIPSRAYYEHVVVNKSLSLIGANKKKTILDGNGTGTVISVTADNVTITKFTIRNSGTNLLNSGIYLNNISNCNIQDNILTNNNNGITLHHTNRTILLNNNVSFNTVDGIHILHSLNNNIENNVLMQNINHGISMELYASNNVLYHNTFINNTNQAYVDAYSSNNIWNDAYLSGGNFWSDYNGTDLLSGPHQNETGSDGIGDTPYVIDGGNQDNYPLMQVWPQHVTPPSIVIISPENVAYASNSVPLTFTVDEPASWMGYSLDNQENVTIPGNITLTGLSEGLHSVVVYANDTYGNMGKSVEANFTIGLARIEVIPDVIDFESGYVVGQNFTIAVVIENVFDLYGFDLQFGWNTTYLEYSDHTVTVPWNDYPNPMPPSPYAGTLNAPTMKLKNAVDEGGISGSEPETMAWFSYCSMSSATGVSGNGTFCVMTFQVKNQSTVDVEVPIYFTATSLTNSHPVKILHTVEEATVKIPRLPPNIVVTSVFAPQTIIGEGYTADFNVTVENQGGYPATFNLTLYANATVIDTAMEVTLTIGNSTTLAFTWNTTGFMRGNYTITAYSTPVQNETDTTDNTLLADEEVCVTIPGDVDGDFDVDLFDAVKLLVRYGTKKGQPKYDPNCDMDGDGNIDLYDAVKLLTNYGKKDP